MSPFTAIVFFPRRSASFLNTLASSQRSLVCSQIHTRCEPEFADVRFIEEFGEATAVVFIRMRKDERGQAGAPILLRQAFEQTLCIDLSWH